MSARKSKRSAKKVATMPPVSVRTIAEEFSIGWCMVEVAMNSLDSQEIGHPEQEVLKRAIKILWPVSEYLSDLEAQLPDDEEGDEEDES